MKENSKHSKAKGTLSHGACDAWTDIYIYIYHIISIIKGSLDEKLPSYEVLKMLKE